MVFKTPVFACDLLHCLLHDFINAYKITWLNRRIMFAFAFRINILKHILKPIFEI